MSHLLALSDAIAAHARLHPGKIGTRDSQRALTFAEWDERATRLANALLGLGLTKGDRVGLLAYNCVEWMEIYVARRAGRTGRGADQLPADGTGDRLHRRRTRKRRR